MLRNTMAAVDVKAGIQFIKQRIQAACLTRQPELQNVDPLLVAVSKTKPPEMIIEAYEAGQYHFGENYVKELETKAQNSEILSKCAEIKWHFIGHLQKNKIKKVLALPNIYMIETVDSESLALAIDKECEKLGKKGMKVLLQVNTSGEEEKNGMEPEEVVEVFKNVKEKCGNLELMGLMTIGKFGYDCNDGPNPDFLCLLKCREELCKGLNLDWKDVELSMGMSGDFEHAIELGSTIVRVGSSIFGYREKKL